MTTVATALGFDVGSKRIGVAVGNGFSGTARDLSVVDMRDEIADWNAIDRLVREWRPDALVIGDPRTPGEDGRQSDATQPSRQRAQRFARDVATRYQIPVWLVDERMSSIDAAARFAQGRAAGARKRSTARNLDAVAAAIILERWLGAPADADRVTVAVDGTEVRVQEPLVPSS
ncbi:MAG TPA: Holliday junction resolvase RuvX [Xanthomonadaceae bacterium]|jgi:putative Holliday junction resolvase|nr:Holliday junction resolvase RuvX [Xanthomonadaceae bacterium]